MITWHEQWPNWSWKRKKGQVKKNYLHVLDKQRENGINTFKIPEIKETKRTGGIRLTKVTIAVKFYVGN